MTSNKFYCNFHPSREAITKCEFCGKFICLECKMIFRKQHSSGFDENKRIYYTNHELCPPCYYDQKIKEEKSSMNLFLMAFGCVFSLVALTMMISAINAFSIIGPVFGFILISGFFILVGIGLFIYGIKRIIKAPQNREDLIQKKEEFYKNISTQNH